jgi:hypothetical protein
MVFRVLRNKEKTTMKKLMFVLWLLLALAVTVPYAGGDCCGTPPPDCPPDCGDQPQTPPVPACFPLCQQQ